MLKFDAIQPTDSAKTILFPSIDWGHTKTRDVFVRNTMPPIEPL